jgi:Flp pilus assembly pilin Flp
MKTRAQGLVEYGMIVVAVVVAAIVAVGVIGPAIGRQFSQVASATGG